MNKINIAFILVIALLINSCEKKTSHDRYTDITRIDYDLYELRGKGEPLELTKEEKKYLKTKTITYKKQILIFH